MAFLKLNNSCYRTFKLNVCLHKVITDGVFKLASAKIGATLDQGHNCIAMSNQNTAAYQSLSNLFAAIYVPLLQITEMKTGAVKQSPKFLRSRALAACANSKISSKPATSKDCFNVYAPQFCSLKCLHRLPTIDSSK